VVTSGNPEGFLIELDLESGEVLEVNVTTSTSIADVVLYTRWIGTMSGGIQGSSVVYHGRALYEEFKLVV
jgi:hypothetical protein